MSTKHRRKPYMPDSDLGKKAWMERFISTIERDPEHYGFTDARKFEYVQRTIRTFITAVEATSARGTRSTSAVAAKNKARKEAVALCRSIAMDIKGDSAFSDAEKQALGIHVHAATPEDAKLPQGELTGSAGFPVLVVQNSPNGGHVIRYRDTTSPSKAKPKGVSHLLLFAAIGDKPHMRRTHARLLGAYTKRPFEIMYPADCSLEGMYVTYYARWLTTRGDMSPWSPGVSKMIGDARASLREVDFPHLFGQQGFIDALPQGGQRRVVEDHPLLKDAACEQDALFELREPKMLPMQGFALLKTQAPK
jgi:hypothetical protein